MALSTPKQNSPTVCCKWSRVSVSKIQEFETIKNLTVNLIIKKEQFLSSLLKLALNGQTPQLVRPMASLARTEMRKVMAKE